MTPKDTKRVFGDELNTEAIHQGIYKLLCITKTYSYTFENAAI